MLCCELNVALDRLLHSIPDCPVTLCSYIFNLTNEKLVQGGFEGLVVYEIESDEAGGDSFTFCFDIDKKGTRAFVGEPHSEANLKYATR